MSVLNVNQINSQVVGKPPVISDANGLEVGQVCTAWAYINSGTVLTSSFNVASVTRTGVGAYHVTFASPMANTDYIMTAGGVFTNSQTFVVLESAAFVKSATQFGIYVIQASTQVKADRDGVYIAFFGGK